MINSSSVDVANEITEAIIAMLKTTLHEAVSCSPGAGWEIVVNLGPPDQTGNRDWDTKLTRRNRYKFRRTV